MADISSYIAAIQVATQGAAIRTALVDALTEINRAQVGVNDIVLRSDVVTEIESGSPENSIPSAAAVYDLVHSIRSADDISY